MAATNPARGQPNTHRGLIDAARRAALELGVEDIFGPWELQWHLEAEFPEETAVDMQAIAREALFELTRDGLIQILKWDPARDEQRGLSLIEAKQALARPATWDPDSPLGPHIRFTATPADERAYYSSPSSAV